MPDDGDDTKNPEDEGQDHSGSDIVDPDKYRGLGFDAVNVGDVLDGTHERREREKDAEFLLQQRKSFPELYEPIYGPLDPDAESDPDPAPDADPVPDADAASDPHPAPDPDPDDGLKAPESIIPDLARPDPIWPASRRGDTDEPHPDAVRRRQIPRWAIPLSVVAAGFVGVVIWLYLNSGGGPAAGEASPPTGDESAGEVQAQAPESSGDQAPGTASDEPTEALVSGEQPIIVGWLVIDVRGDWVPDVSPFDLDPDPDPATEFTGMYVAADRADEEMVIGLCFGGAVEGNVRVGFDLFVGEAINILYRGGDGSYKASALDGSSIDGLDLDMVWVDAGHARFTLEGYTPGEAASVRARSLVAGDGPPPVYSADEMEAVLNLLDANPVADTDAWGTCP